MIVLLSISRVYNIWSPALEKDYLKDHLNDYLLLSDGGKTVSNKQSLNPSINKHTHSIYFLKISKSGSSTLAQTMLNIAWWQGVRVATYEEEPVLKSPGVVPNPGPLVSTLVPPFTMGKSRRYNMITYHSVYVRRDVDAVLEPPITYVTLIRDPLTRLRSFLNTNPNISQVRSNGKADVAQYFLESYTTPGWFTKTHLSWARFDRMWLSYFFNANHSSDRQHLLKTLHEVKRDFVIGLTEHYELSMVLLKRKLKLTFKEIMYIPVRVGNQKVRSNQTKRLKQLFCNLAPNDCFIYDFLKSSFWETVKKQSHDIFTEAEYFRISRNQVSSYCKNISGTISKNYETWDPQFSFSQYHLLDVRKSEWNEPFQFTPEGCLLLILSEKAMYPLIFFKQNPSTECGKLTRCPYVITELKLCKFLCKISKENTTSLLKLIILNDLGNFFWQ